MKYKMIVMRTDSVFKIAQLIAEFTNGQQYTGIAAMRTFLPIRHAEEDVNLTFALVPETLNTEHLKINLAMFLEIFEHEPKAKRTEEIFNLLLSQIGSYQYGIPVNKRNINLVCSGLANYLKTYGVFLDEEFLLEDLETTGLSNDRFFYINSTVHFEFLDYFGEPVILDDVDCWKFDPVLFHKQFGDT